VELVAAAWVETAALLLQAHRVVIQVTPLVAVVGLVMEEAQPQAEQTALAMVVAVGVDLMVMVEM
tara:strand:+ start:116 stop:310 length:195 start_codon:yes stop_codon:yes gene_type:complete